MQPLPVLLEQLDSIHQDNRRERFHDLDLQLPVTEAQLPSRMDCMETLFAQSLEVIESSETAPSALGQQLWNHIQDRF